MIIRLVYSSLNKDCIELHCFKTIDHTNNHLNIILLRHIIEAINIYMHFVSICFCYEDLTNLQSSEFPINIRIFSKQHIYAE